MTYNDEKICVNFKVTKHDKILKKKKVKNINKRYEVIQTNFQ